MVKVFLILELRNIDFFIILIYIKFLNLLFFNFLDLGKFLTILSTLSPFISSTILLLSAFNVFRVYSDNSVFFNIKVNSTVILKKFWIKYQ